MDQPSRMLAWWLAARPKTLWAGVGPVVLGTALAAKDAHAHIPSAVCALLASMLIQVATNFWNDYADFKRGADTAERKGPRRATQSGWIAPHTMRNAALLTFGLSALFSIYLVIRAGWPLMAVGVVSILSGLAYTGGPRPLGYLGLGDPFVFIFFGPVATAGTYYAQALQLHTAPVVAGCGPGALAVAILVVNNLRDRNTDARVGKRTLAVRFGPTFARLEYTACLALAAVIPWILYRLDYIDSRDAWAGLSVLPGWRPLTRVWFHEGEDLNPALAHTALILLLYCFMCSVGWLI